MTQRRRSRRGWGAIRKLPSGRYQASFTGPDTNRHTAPDTFDTRLDAEAWLALTRGSIVTGAWRAPNPDIDDGPLTFGAWAEAWIENRDLRDTTRRIYRHALDTYILPTFGAQELEAITPSSVTRWVTSLRRQTGPTQAAHSYQVLRAILNTAVREDLVPANPCRVPGAGQARRASEILVLEPSEVERLAETIEPSLNAFVLVGAWGGLRIGELLELRRRDFDPKTGQLSVTRQVQHPTGSPPVTVSPKTLAGSRTIYLPPHVVKALSKHVATYAEPGRDGLLFPADRGGWRVPSTTRRSFKRAAEAIGRPDLKVHTLRHTAAVLAARTGATVAELQARLGHSSPAAAMRYQHSVQSRDAEIAARLSSMAGVER
ncbi:MAG: tyrosine-type recombinase/integrase [Cellulomonadaceae bacterium]